MQRIFWFTIDYSGQGNSIDPPGGSPAAYRTLQSFFQQRPLWS